MTVLEFILKFMLYLPMFAVGVLILTLSIAFMRDMFDDKHER